MRATASCQVAHGHGCRAKAPSTACSRWLLSGPVKCTRRSAACGAAATAFTGAPQLDSVVLKNGVVDFYSVLQVDDDASEEEIKAAYRQLAKVCHPDFAGDAGHNICILLNEAYDTLMNSMARKAYDAQLEVALQDDADGYTGRPVSKWIPDIKPKMSRATDPNESRAVFVDENCCIGCMNCVYTAPATFRMNHEYGRARVFGQWLSKEEDIATAVLSCPVDCIHWVDREELPALEHVCQKVQRRVNVAVMMTNSGRGGDVFAERDKFLKMRRKLEEKRKAAAEKASPMQEEARRRAAQDLARKQGGWWGTFSHNLRASFSSAAAGSTASTDPDEEFQRVGRRKRSVSWRDMVPKQAQVVVNGGTVPMDRALVPVMSKMEDF